ncbi:MAG: hypothetical protein WA705_29400 [Candidatus Ozemobacteraceae bacterium]
MPNDNTSGNPFIKAACLALLVMLLLAVFSVVPSDPGRSVADNHGSAPSDEVQKFMLPVSTDNAELETLINGRKASVRQIKPGLSGLSPEAVSSNKPVSSDFHKLPAEYFMPQSPETTRKAAVSIKGLKEALSGSAEAGNTIIHDNSGKEQTGQ